MKRLPCLTLSLRRQKQWHCSIMCSHTYWTIQSAGRRISSPRLQKGLGSGALLHQTLYAHAPCRVRLVGRSNLEGLPVMARTIPARGEFMKYLF